jgi:hypothetical protein
METGEKKPHINVDYFEDLTGQIEEGTCSQPEGGQEDIGQRIKAIREAKGLSLDELSHMTGFDVELLPALSAVRFSPSWVPPSSCPRPWTAPLGGWCPVWAKSYIPSPAKGSRRRFPIHFSEGQKQAYTYKSLAPEVKGRHMESLIVQLEEAPDKERSVHDGEEFIYVLDGRFPWTSETIISI